MITDKGININVKCISGNTTSQLEKSIDNILHNELSTKAIQDIKFASKQSYLYALIIYEK